jgi:hypothetical protein
MDLVEKLDKLAKDLSVWPDGAYDQFTADVRDLLEQAANQIRSDRAWISHLQQHSRTTSSRSF